MNTYQQLLIGMAKLHSFDDPEKLLEVEEVVIDDVSIGLICLSDPDSGDLGFFAQVGHMGTGPDVAGQLRFLLHANHLWAATRGATLGLQHDDTDTVVLSSRLPLEGLTPERLAHALLLFCDVVRNWRIILSHPIHQTSNADLLEIV